jgi:methylated-DNA-protein-cysteine methyltransferase-like protein
MQSFEEIYEVVRLIPSGRVTSYGAIAKYLGTGARLVGWAMNASHGSDVPAHRVVNHQGRLTGKMHFEAPDTMQLLLESEGISISNDAIKNFKTCFWDPSIELL